ncbi:MAG: AAA family ATPase [Myroides sp.]|jgi:predicted ATPase|nr:AAA family ATPase [Myroides sp.]
MRLEHVSDYLSIKKFADIELSDFSVITGVNGAGKSHLLNAIDKGHIKIEGIDSENIILYNYNDFNVVDVDFNQNNNQTSELINKKQIFQNKSNLSSSKYNDKRNQILDSFQTIERFNSFDLDDNTVYNLQGMTNLDWTEDEKIYYCNEFDINNPNTTHSSYYKFESFYHHTSWLNINKKEDLNQFLEASNNIIKKREPLSTIRYFNYNCAFKTIDDTKFHELLELFKANPIFEYWSEENRNRHPHFILDVLGFIRDQGNIDKIKPIEYLSTLKELYNEIETYFISSIHPDMLKQIQSINGDNILMNVSFDNGFFNLNDIALEEKNFQIQKALNQFNEFQNSKNTSVHFYSEEEFKNVFGESPVKVLNDVLNEYDVNGYEFKTSNITIDLYNGTQNQNIHVSLYNKKEGFYTQLNSLSSGEKTLLALAFSVFKLKKNKIFARVLLMDELDSALHPLMSKRLINVLYNYFYKTLGIKIIISSHSPSTIAFSPDDSLYIIKKDDMKKLHHVSKDEALKELTIGVPSFSINYENRRQVFVESKYDVEYYDALYNIFQEYLNKEVSLNFIASGDVQKDKHGQPTSSCDVVKNVTEVLRNAGNKSVYGIIDWDLAKSKNTNFYVVTLGFGARYSIENYIFDPLLVGIFILKEKIVKPNYFGFDNEFSLQSLFTLSNQQCQTIIDKICTEILDKINTEKKCKEINEKFGVNITIEEFYQKNSYKTIGGIELQIPYYINVLQGHELEEKLHEIFVALKDHSKQKENLLKQVFISKVIEDFKTYTPNELLEVFKAVQK